MRIDKFLAEKFGSRTKAAEAIGRGLVTVNGKIVSPSYEVKDSDSLSFVRAEESYVSNGGYKLSKALKDFGLSVKDKTFIDVGESQLDKSLRDKNVIVIDNFNARNLNKEMFREEIDGAVIDVSFISLTYILKNVADVIGEKGYIIALIKPQFECEGGRVGKNGIVKDAATHKRVIEKICRHALECGLCVENLTNAPINQGKNLEYLVLLSKRGINKPINLLIKYVKL